MHETTAKVLDLYLEHLNELQADGSISPAGAASARFYAWCAANGTDPYSAAAEEAEEILRDAG